MTGRALSNAASPLVPLRQMRHLSLTMPSSQAWIEGLVWQPIAYSELHLCSHYYPVTVRLVRNEPMLGVLLNREFLIRPLVDDSGVWQSGYLPMAVRSFPFQSTGASDDPLDDLIVPSDSPLFGKSGTIPVLDPAGKLNKPIAGIHMLARRLNESRRNLVTALDHLLIAGVLKPMSRDVADESAQATPYLTVDRTAMAQLMPSALAPMTRHRFAAVDIMVACLFSQAQVRPNCLPRVDNPAAAAPSAAAANAFPLFTMADTVVVDDGELLSFADLEAAMASLRRPDFRQPFAGG